MKSHVEDKQKIQGTIDEINEESSQDVNASEKENEKLKFEKTIMTENQLKLQTVEEMIKKAEKRFEKETDRKQKMFV